MIHRALESLSGEQDTALIDRLQQDPSHGSALQPAVRSVWWTTENAMTMSSVVLAFGAIVIGLSAYLAIRQIPRDVILRIVVIPMAIMSALFLVVAGYDDSQIAPAMGLLGTIIGYILGTAKQAALQEKDVTEPSSAVKNAASMAANAGENQS